MLVVIRLAVAGVFPAAALVLGFILAELLDGAGGQDPVHGIAVNWGLLSTDTLLRSGEPGIRVP